MKEYLAQSKKIQEEATKGPWKLDKDLEVVTEFKGKPIRKIIVSFGENSVDEDDMKFIAESRTRWTKETQALEIAIEALRKHFKHCKEPVNLGIAASKIEEILK